MLFFPGVFPSYCEDAAGKVRNSSPVFISHTAMLLPSSSSVKDSCGPRLRLIGSFDIVTRYFSLGEKSMSDTSGCANFRSLPHDGPPQSTTPSRWTVASMVPNGDHCTYASAQRYRLEIERILEVSMRTEIRLNERFSDEHFVLCQCQIEKACHANGSLPHCGFL